MIQLVVLKTCLLFAMSTDNYGKKSFDGRPTLSRSEARDVYDSFATDNHKQGGQDASSGYGGSAVTALLNMADFGSATTVLDYGCGQGKMAELVLSQHDHLSWWGVDQSPNMVQRFQQRCVDRFGTDKCRAELLENGNPSCVKVPEDTTVDRFVSTYCLDLLSEDDMYSVLDLAQSVLHPTNGILLLAGITWGYKDSVSTFVMTGVWEILYRVWRKKVGGCRPQTLRPYLEAKGWEIVQEERTLPNGYPWMVSEVICARPPTSSSTKE